MATTTAFEYRQGNPDGNGRNSSVISGFATIDNGETATLPIYCGGRALVRLGFPSAFTGTTVTFTVQAFPPADPASPTADPSFRPLYDDAGNQVSVTVSTDRSIEVPELSGAYAFTIVSGSAEAAARRIEVQCVGAQPTTPASNKITVENTSSTPVPPSGSTNALSNATSTAAEASRVIKASAGRLFGMTVMSTAAQYIQLFNATSAPADTTVPIISFDIAANTAKSIDFGEYGRYFSTGIVVTNSSTATTKTIGSTTCLFDAQYV